jgi:hypothetical protein
MSELTSTEIRAMLRKLLQPAFDGELPINIRTAVTRNGTDFDEPKRREWVGIDDFMHLLTRLSENVMDDNKQMAYRGLRDLLEALKYDRIPKNRKGNHE